MSGCLGIPRGFTGHEQVDGLGIVHMNGRIYDPKLGRMLQADPFVQSPTNSQSLNRYSYVLNNPLSYTDPTGYFSFSRFIKKWGRVIVAAVAAYFTWGASYAWAANAIASGAASSFGFAQFVGAVGWQTLAGAAAGAISGFVGGAIAGGTIKSAFQGAFAGGLMGGIASHYGDVYSIERVAADTLAGGISSSVSGQKFKDGLLFGALVSSMTYLTVRARAYSVAQSKKVPHNIGSNEFEFRGIPGKIEGERINLQDWKASGAQAAVENGMAVEKAIDELYIPFRGGTSPLGCVQSGNSCFFGIPVSSDNFLSYVMGGFGGIHDLFNQLFYYNADGTNRVLNGFVERALGKVINPVNVFLAAPIVVPALVPDYARHLYFQGTDK